MSQFSASSVAARGYLPLRQSGVRVDVRTRTPAGMPPLDASGRPISYFEFWPTFLFYLPIIAYWVMLSIRYRSATLPTAANPYFPTGGLCDDSKAAIFDLLRGTAAESWFAPQVAIKRTRSVGADRNRAFNLMVREGLLLPVVAKPDLGCRGAGVRLIESDADLQNYLAAFPEGQTVILQRYIEWEGEAGVLYVRDPDNSRGCILSLTLKYLPYVIGDGCSSLRGLIMADPRAGRIASVYLSRHKEHLEEILPQGVPYRLSFAGNHFRGAIFRNGNSYITNAIKGQFDEIARAIPEFHFGRFDVRFRDIDAFQRGENFTILEVNGVSSEPIEIWDRNTRLVDAYRTMFAQISLLFRYGRDNRTRGFKPTHILEVFWRFLRERRLSTRYPVTE